MDRRRADLAVPVVVVATGEPVSAFGANGRVDLRMGLDRDPGMINQQSRLPGRVFENLIIVGSATNEEYASAPGDIRAFDAQTGKLVWTFHTVPRPSEFGYETWPPDASKRVSPYLVAGAGRGVERPNVNEFFPYGVDRTIVVIYYGGGARIPLHRRLDAFADWRLIITGDDAAEMAVLGPLRAGVAFRF